MSRRIVYIDGPSTLTWGDEEPAFGAATRIEGHYSRKMMQAIENGERIPPQTS